MAALIQSLLMLLREQRPDFIACAFDHVVESFRNDLFAGYKTGEDVPDELMTQFELAEDASRALGIVTWPMVEFEADDAIATAVARLSGDVSVDQTVICSVDKDLMALVNGEHVVVWDRRRDITYSEAAVRDRFGVSPASIPDYLALVGDSADGIPGVRRWGARGTAAVLSEYDRLEAVPESYDDWTLKVRGGQTLARNLVDSRADAWLYKELATLRTDVPISEDLDDLRWKGVRRSDYLALCDRLGLERLKSAPVRWQ